MTVSHHSVIIFTSFHKKDLCVYMMVFASFHDNESKLIKGETLCLICFILHLWDGEMMRLWIHLANISEMNVKMNILMSSLRRILRCIGSYRRKNESDPHFYMMVFQNSTIISTSNVNFIIYIEVMFKLTCKTVMLFYDFFVAICLCSKQFNTIVIYIYVHVCSLSKDSKIAYYHSYICTLSLSLLRSTLK